jgi:hypothetical protein
VLTYKNNENHLPFSNIKDMLILGGRNSKKLNIFYELFKSNEDIRTQFDRVVVFNTDRLSKIKPHKFKKTNLDSIAEQIENGEGKLLCSIKLTESNADTFQRTLFMLSQSGYRIIFDEVDGDIIRYYNIIFKFIEDSGNTASTITFMSSFYFNEFSRISKNHFSDILLLSSTNKRIDFAFKCNCLHLLKPGEFVHLKQTNFNIPVYYTANDYYLYISIVNGISSNKVLKDEIKEDLVLEIEKKHFAGLVHVFKGIDFELLSADEVESIYRLIEATEKIPYDKSIIDLGL